MKVLVTGCAGFIGMHVSEKLLQRGDTVLGIDNLNAYYDVALKESRLKCLKAYPNFSFRKIDITDLDEMNTSFDQFDPQRVVHLAAQAGVRYSISNPQAYIDSNIQGFINLLEACRHHQVEHLVYASSSSVYGDQSSLPFREEQNIDRPVSLYAATKKANELMAHSYSHLFNLPTTGLRLFTVYGPWGRPDMALFLFTKAILENRPIDIFNYGKMKRDFTFIDDISEGVVRVLDKPPALSEHNSPAPYQIFNMGNSSPLPLIEYIAALEEALGIQAKKNLLPLQAGDVVNTGSDTTALNKWIGFAPNTSIDDGMTKFVQWYKEYYKP